MSNGSLRGLRVTHLTSGHQVTDSRVYDREALSLAAKGATVTVVGQDRGWKTGRRPVPTVKVRTPNNRFERFALQPWRCWAAASPLNSDILHIHDIELLQIIPWVRLIKRKTKVIYDVHEDFPNLVLIRGYVPAALKSGLRFIVNVLEKGAVRLVDGVVGVTDPLADKFKKERRISTYNFPSAAFYERAKETLVPLKERKYDLVHLGTLSTERSSFLIEMLQLLYSQRPKTRTLITGVHKHIQGRLKSSLPPACDVEGLIPYDSVPSRLCDARIGIDLHPFETPNLNVAVPVKVFEYMACGCAIVISALPVLDSLISKSEIAPEDVATIKGDDPQQYAKAVAKLLSSLEGDENIGARLRTAAERSFVWEIEAKKLEMLYVDILR